MPSNRDHFPRWTPIAANARSLGQTCHVYAEENHRHFPPHLASLLLTGLISSEQLTDFEMRPFQLPTPLPPPADWPTIATDVDAHSLFIYAAADLVEPAPADCSLDPAIIVAYTKPTHILPHTRILAFADGSAERVADSDLARYFTASNTARTKLRLPAFSLDGPPPPPPP